MLGKSTLDNQSSSVLNSKSCAFLSYLIRVADTTCEQKGGRTVMVLMLAVFENMSSA